ncbi:MAG: hypothetical protein ACU83N_02630 [Gammaproteobacteria bacterium]
MNIKEELEKFADGLNQLRDEIKVQMHLASMESRQEWDKAEKEWSHFRSQLDKISGEPKGNVDDLISKAKIVGEELNETYRRLKDRLSK